MNYINVKSNTYHHISISRNYTENSTKQAYCASAIIIGVCSDGVSNHRTTLRVSSFKSYYFPNQSSKFQLLFFSVLHALKIIIGCFIPSSTNERLHHFIKLQTRFDSLIACQWHTQIYIYIYIYTENHKIRRLIDERINNQFLVSYYVPKLLAKWKANNIYNVKYQLQTPSSQRNKTCPHN